MTEKWLLIHNIYCIRNRLARFARFARTAVYECKIQQCLFVFLFKMFRKVSWLKKIVWTAFLVLSGLKMKTMKERKTSTGQKRPRCSTPKGAENVQSSGNGVPRKRILIQVGGRIFETWEENFKNHPSTLLGSNEKELYFNARRNMYIFDRDPQMFRHILNYYR